MASEHRCAVSNHGHRDGLYKPASCYRGLFFLNNVTNIILIYVRICMQARFRDRAVCHHHSVHRDWYLMNMYIRKYGPCHSHYIQAYTTYNIYMDSFINGGNIAEIGAFISSYTSRFVHTLSLNMASRRKLCFHIPSIS